MSHPPAPPRPGHRVARGAPFWACRPPVRPPASCPPTLPPPPLSRYKVLRQVGDGAYGAVWEAVLASTGEVVSS